MTDNTATDSAACSLGNNTDGLSGSVGTGGSELSSGYSVSLGYTALAVDGSISVDGTVTAMAYDSGVFLTPGAPRVGSMTFDMQTFSSVVSAIAPSASNSESILITDGTYVYSLGSCQAKPGDTQFGGCASGMCLSVHVTCSGVLSPVPIMLGVPLTIITSINLNADFLGRGD